MYSIFSSKSHKVKQRLVEGEPPPKKLMTEGDVLIKNLSEKQLRTNVSLSEQLSNQKEFAKCETFSDVSAHISGTNNLNEFQTCVADVDRLNELRNLGLSDRDIELYREYKTSEETFWSKWKTVNVDALREKLDSIIRTIEGRNDGDATHSGENASRHHVDYLNSLKPQSLATKLLKFAEENKSKQTTFPSPMDGMPDIEAELMQNIQEYTCCDLKKIRKKARSLGNKTSSDNREMHSLDVPINHVKASTLWDVKEVPDILKINPQIVEKNKVYTCKPEILYTIRNGQIVKLDDIKSAPARCSSTKLSIEEIKQIPKFANYQPGDPCKVLFIKNLSRSVSSEILKELLVGTPKETYSIKIMNGKMRGQAFIEFNDCNQATAALDLLNGTVVNGKPLIVQFGRKK